MNETDPAGHLAWLAEQLQIAEDNGEKVCDGRWGGIGGGCGIRWGIKWCGAIFK